MSQETLPYIILEDAYYIAIDISKIVKSLRPGYPLAAVAKTAGDVSALILCHSCGPTHCLHDGYSIEILKDAGVDIPLVFISEYSHLAKKVENFSNAAFILKPETCAGLQTKLFQIEKNLKQQISTML
ncbi:MAG: hypothetical protein ACI4BC_00350 [Muribaculaceae bacterium]